MSSITDVIDENHWSYGEFKDLGINCGRTIKRFIRSVSTLARKSANLSQGQAIVGQKPKQCIVCLGTKR